MQRAGALTSAAFLALVIAACSGPLFPVGHRSGAQLLRLNAAVPREATRGWCSPERGAPPDPTVGLVVPLRIGIGSIVTEQDGTTESFLARTAWVDKSWVEGRAAKVILIDHPTDADYAISGDISGDLAYQRIDPYGAGTVTAVAVGYGVGGTLTFVGLLTAVLGHPQNWALELGGAGMGVGLGAQVHTWASDGNEYRWALTGHFTLRRNGVRIGEFFIDERGNESSFGPRGAGYRASVLARLWEKARLAIAPCIASDLAPHSQGANG